MVDKVRFEMDGGLAVVTLANPNGNRIDLDVAQGLRVALERAGASEVRAILLRGEGDAFSYGADVGAFPREPSAFVAALQGYMDFLAAWESLKVPTVAAVHGVCSSGGFELALACDQIVAAAGTKIGFMEANIATPPLAGGVQRVAERAGPRRAFALASAGRLFDAEELATWGVVDQVVPVDRFEEESRASAAKLAAGPTLAHSATKHLLKLWREHGVAGADRAQVPSTAGLFGSQDVQAAMAAYAAGGPSRTVPTFVGR